VLSHSAGGLLPATLGNGSARHGPVLQAPGSDRSACSGAA